MIPVGVLAGSADAAPTSVTCTYLTTVNDTADKGAGVSRTASVDIGAEASDRVIVLMIASRLTTGSVTAATINGVSATIVNHNVGANWLACAYATVPTGGTVTIAYTHSGAAPRGVMAVYRLTGDPVFNASATGSASGTNTNTGAAATVASTAGGAVIAAVNGSNASGGMANTWTNVTEDVEVYSETATKYSAAHVATASAGNVAADPSLNVATDTATLAVAFRSGA